MQQDLKDSMESKCRVRGEHYSMEHEVGGVMCMRQIRDYEEFLGKVFLCSYGIGSHTVMAQR